MLKKRNIQPRFCRKNMRLRTKLFGGNPHAPGTKNSKPLQHPPFTSLMLGAMGSKTAKNIKGCQPLMLATHDSERHLSTLSVLRKNVPRFMETIRSNWEEQKGSRKSRRGWFFHNIVIIYVPCNIASWYHIWYSAQEGTNSKGNYRFLIKTVF